MTLSSDELTITPNTIFRAAVLLIEAMRRRNGLDGDTLTVRATNDDNGLFETWKITIEYSGSERLQLH